MQKQSRKHKSVVLAVSLGRIMYKMTSIIAQMIPAELRIIVGLIVIDERDTYRKQ